MKIWDLVRKFRESIPEVVYKYNSLSGDSMYRIRKVDNGFVVLLSSSLTPQQTVKTALLTRAKELRELAEDLEKDARNLSPRE